MTGFKSGASEDDPLSADDSTEDGSDETSGAPQSHPTETQQTDGPTVDTLPWIYSRSSITDGRPKTVQLHLQQSTVEREHEALRDVPIEGTINKADFREAAYVVGLEHLDDVAEQLREWGYDL